jgi:hypothetical protein
VSLRFAKHAHKPAVRAFYAAMAGVAGDKLERVGAAQHPETSAPVQPAAAANPAASAAGAAASQPHKPPPRCVITELD